MRILLDAHVSGKRIANALRDAGLLVFGIDHGRFAEIGIGLERVFSDRPAQEDWTDITQPLSRSQAR